MAAPITHIVLTNKVYSLHFSDKSYEEFIIGTSFPDIRYLGLVDRNKTHFPNESLAKIKTDDSFISGLKFHSLLDKVRERFLLSHDLYSKCHPSKYITQSIKFLEDVTLYNNVVDWDKYIKFFDKIKPAELKFGMNTDTIDYWHKTLQLYISKQPDDESIDTFVTRIKLPKEVASEIKDNISVIRQNPEVLEYINGLYSKFEDLIQENS